jgi:hypothetical protein
MEGRWTVGIQCPKGEGGVEAEHGGAIAAPRALVSAGVGWCSDAQISIGRSTRRSGARGELT